MEGRDGERWMLCFVEEKKLWTRSWWGAREEEEVVAEDWLVVEPGVAMEVEVVVEGEEVTEGAIVDIVANVSLVKGFDCNYQKSKSNREGGAKYHAKQDKQSF